MTSYQGSYSLKFAKSPLLLGSIKAWLEEFDVEDSRVLTSLPSKTQIVSLSGPTSATSDLKKNILDEWTKVPTEKLP